MLLAVQAILDDPGFTVSSPLAASAVQTAKQLQEWSQSSVENKLDFDLFASQLVSELNTAFQPSSGGQKCPRVQREKMWGKYHLIRSSAVFRERWFGILQPIHGCTPYPVFYQYVTDIVFKQLIKHHYSASEQSDDTHGQVEDLTYEEMSALRYAAGYVCRAMRKEFKSNPEILAAIDELIDDSKGEGDEGLDWSNDWMKLVSRGGLLFVKDTTYMVFHAMELVVRKHFCKELVAKLSPGSTSMLIELVRNDENVQFYSCMLFAEVEEGVASILLHSIIKLWVTMRGFSFASSWIELYKQNAKKSLQRSKGLRKTLFTD